MRRNGSGQEKTQRNQWEQGGHNVATVDTFYGTCQEMEHKAPVYDTLANPVKIRIEVEKV